MALRKRRPGLVYPTWEDWHYVGEVGEPAFGTSWANAAGNNNLAFRIREAGVVDIQGYVQNTAAPTAPTSDSLFTLPAGYRPAAETFQGMATVTTDDVLDGLIISPVVVATSGAVFLPSVNTDPVFDIYAGAHDGVALYVKIHGFFFLDPADAP
jgi:hypothetical protein